MSRTVDEALAGTSAPVEASTSTATVRTCRRHEWVHLRDIGTGEDVKAECRVCHRAKDDARSRRGRTARNRGNQFERDVAKRLGIRRVGQFGGQDDVAGDWIVAQCKVGSYYPERIDGWLRALPANADQLKAVVIGDAPGSSGRRRTLIVLDFHTFVDWFGRAPQTGEQAFVSGPSDPKGPEPVLGDGDEP